MMATAKMIPAGRILLRSFPARLLRDVRFGILNSYRASRPKLAWRLPEISFPKTSTLLEFYFETRPRKPVRHYSTRPKKQITKYPPYPQHIVVRILPRTRAWGYRGRMLNLLVC